MFSKNLFHKEYDEEKWINFRRFLHMWPETKNVEFKTQQFVISYLKSLKNYSKLKLFEFSKQLKTGFWVDLTGEFKNRDNLINKKVIAFRGDMDALPIKEETNVTWKSKNDNVAHSCGHDGHITILSCFLEYILENLDKIPENLTIRFLYQPAEEAGGGATRLIEMGCLENVDQIYNIHNTNMYPLGTIGVKSGPIMAASMYFNIKIEANNSFNSSELKSSYNLIDSPLTSGCQLVEKINSISSQEIDSGKRCSICVTSFNSGKTFSEYPEDCIIKGTIRFYDNELINKVSDILNNICKGIEQTNGVKVESLITGKSGIACINDKKLTEEVFIPGICKYFTISSENLPSSTSDDFSRYQQLVPGVYGLLGSNDEDHFFINHNPKFDFNDKAIPYGVEVYIRIVETIGDIKLINDL